MVRRALPTPHSNARIGLSGFQWLYAIGQNYVLAGFLNLNSILHKSLDPLAPVAWLHALSK